MTPNLPLDRMRQRVELDRDDSDTAYFYALLFYAEFAAKLAIAVLVAGIRPDKDRHHYRIARQLVKADSIGNWSKALDDILLGPSAHFLDPALHDIRKSLTQKLAHPSWQHSAVSDLHEVHRLFQPHENPGTPRKAALRTWWHLLTEIRNRTRGHGAPRGDNCRAASDLLQRSIDTVTEHLDLFRLPLAYLHQNLSGKYRVTCLAGSTDPFELLKRESHYKYPDGVYVALTQLRPLELFKTDPEATDFFVPNGKFNSNTFQWHSPLTDTTHDGNAIPYLQPPEDLPPSETEGIGDLEVIGTTFTNIPAPPNSYISRPTLENQLSHILLHERHEVVSLSGPGGIGKTYLALKVIHDIAASDRFSLIIWFSARDIDLLSQGPKTVRPHVFTISDFAIEFVSLLSPGAANEDDFSPTDFLAEYVKQSQVGPALFVIDNFETVENPAEIYRWFDTYIRPPNKILITTRIREFVGDYPIRIRGMELDESRALIDHAARSFAISQLVTESVQEDIHRESDGHPYVMKILVGEMAKAGKPGKIERIAGGQEDILTALFERSFSSLDAASQRVFLTLASWRSLLPEVAVEAVLLRPHNERIDVRKAIERLKLYSFVEEETDPTTNEVVLNVPLAAAVYGRQQLAISPWRTAVMADVEFLKELGPLQKTDLRRGITPRLKRFFGSLVEKIAGGQVPADEVIPIIEFVARRVPTSWLTLAEIVRSLDPPIAGLSEKGCLTRFIEHASDDDVVAPVWKRLAQISRDAGDHFGEIQALVEMTKAPSCSSDAVSDAANRINAILHDHPLAVGDPDQKHLLVREIAEELDTRSGDLDATGYSRLAWLWMHLKDDEKALECARRGLNIDPQNPHCLNLVDRIA